MGFLLSRLWKPFTTIEKTAETGQAVFELAKTLKENKDKDQVKQLVEKIPTLLEALNSPLGQVVSSSLPFVSLATGLIKFTIDVTKKEPTIAQTVAIVVQAAYLESIKETLKSESMFTQNNNEASKVVKKQIRKLGELEIDDREARLALVYFSDSRLAKAFNEVLSARLQENEIDKSDAETWVAKVAANTSQYIYPALAEGGEGVQKLLDWYSSGGREEFEKYLSIDTYLKERIKPLPEQQVFEENFSFQDIYVPLKAISLDRNGKEIRNADDFVLEEWAKEFITNPETSDKVLFIQAGAGRGKTVFCRMFADWVRRNLHPRLTPIVIRLRDVFDFNRDIGEIISSALSNRYFVNRYSEWLADRRTRYLFLLDGFDELRMNGRGNDVIKDFIDKVGMFQKNSVGQETGHRVIMTGRPLAMQEIHYLPNNFERVELLPMDNDLCAKWLEKWQQVIPDAAEEEAEKFKGFLEADECPPAIKDELAREPLLSYLLAKLHKEKKIQQKDFQEASNGTQAKILIYEKSLDCVLTQLKDESLLAQIIGLTNIDTLKDSLKRILTEAGLCVVQSGGESTKVEMIETRLGRDDSDAVGIMQKLPNRNVERYLTKTLGVFYLRPAAAEKEVEFYHKSFSEFLCAKRLQASLEEWTKEVSESGNWLIDNKQLPQQIYDLLGYGGLTPEIVEYLWGLLLKNEAFAPQKLFQRLLDFYERWCDGEFIDALPDNNYPQKTKLELKDQLPKRQANLGLRQVDIYAGLNIMILLLELHRYGQAQIDEIKQQLTFYPCGQPQDNGTLEEPKRLLRLIGYSNCIGMNGFRDTVASFLKSANLHGANLYGVNLCGVNLCGANLYGVNLCGANLYGANLHGANLVNADLCGANLVNADLHDAIHGNSNLCRTNLVSTDLHGADLVSADLHGADLVSADLHGANLHGADLHGTNLVNADLHGANLVNTKLYNVKLVRANLHGADLRGADLRGADLHDAKLGGADIRGADLRKTDLRGADLHDTKLSHAKLGGVNLRGANLVNADLHDANLCGANLCGANLVNADLHDAKLRGANLCKANLGSANLKGVILFRADLVNANLKNSNLERANLEHTNLINVQNLTSSQIKSTCHWKNAFYQGYWDDRRHKLQVDEKANYEFIERLKQDELSNPIGAVDCRRWQ